MSQPTRRESMRTVQGRGVSAGVALGPAVLYLPESGGAEAPTRTISSAEVAGEQARLRQAIARARADLDALAQQVGQTIGQAEAGIFTAQSLMLADPSIAERAEALIAERMLDAIGAIRAAGEEQAALLRAQEYAVLQSRAADVQDIVGRVVQRLQASMRTATLAALIARAGEPPILIARDLTPSDTVQLQPERIAGICLALGGPTSHAAILARALGIPTVVGAGEDLLTIFTAGDLVGLDASTGEVFAQADEATIARLRIAATAARQERTAAQAAAKRWRTTPGATRDGWRVIIAANVGSVEEATVAARDWGAEAIGLLRTEFLFGGREVMPDEDEQAELYAQIFAAFADREQTQAPIVARTMDAGADKPIPALRHIVGKEENPALGYRGLRIHLGHLDLLRVQVRALLRAAGATHAPLHIMFPMVATLAEVRQAKQVVVEAQQHLRAKHQAIPEQVPIGMMVETPAAAFMADLFAREVDFFSIGTNDLTQYVMACDRLNPQVGHLYDPLDPAVLRAIRAIARAGQIAGRPVAVCGEMASTPALGALLVGLGITELSMSAAHIPAMKAALAQASYAALRKWADHALELATLAEVRGLVAAGMPTD